MELVEGTRSKIIPSMPKLKIPRLHGEKGWPKFKKSFESFALMHEFSDVLESAMEVNVGRSSVRRHEEMGRLGITAETFNLHLKAWMILYEAFPNVVDQGRLTKFTSPSSFWRETKVNYSAKRTAECPEIEAVILQNLEKCQPARAFSRDRGFSCRSDGM